MSKIRTRFAPSPTGFVHIGSLRTALFSFLFARKNKGTHILRIEDTDQNRLTPGATENLVKVLGGMGIEFDEGFFLDEHNTLSEKGEYGPYLQSRRVDLYRKHALQLVEKGQAYYCFCSEERLAELRKEQTALKKPPMYDRLCRKLEAAEVARRLAAKENHVIRFLIPEGETKVEDLIHGEIVYQNSVLDDQVILKSDGFPTYHLAVVVDDHAMEITHVIRGEEWISSTPKHLLLYQAFGWQPTAFAHLPLILNPDRSKLSKRQGDVAVEDFVKAGYLKEALINFVAFLGWNPKTEQEIFSLPELIEQFDLSKVNKSGAVMDTQKLDWLNQQHIKNLSEEELAKLCDPFMAEVGDLLNIVGSYDKWESYRRAIVSVLRESLKKLSDIKDKIGYFYSRPEYEAQLLIWKKSDAATTKANLEALSNFLAELPEDKWGREELELSIQAWLTDKSLDVGSVLWPMRVALTGQKASPGPFEVAAVLALGFGKGEVLNRIALAIQKL